MTEQNDQLPSQDQSPSPSEKPEQKQLDADSETSEGIEIWDGRECVSCALGRPEECLYGGCLIPPVAEPVTSLGEAFKERVHGGTAKQLKDPLSTGRKRAAKLYPIHDSEPCEWRGQKNCGGGERPITGCLSGNQESRHHGPVKDTTRNHQGNVHRICTKCHNRWHLLNDLIYDQERYSLLPHDPSPCGEDELWLYEAKWASGQMNKEFELAHGSTLKKRREANEDI